MSISDSEETTRGAGVMTECVLDRTVDDFLALWHEACLKMQDGISQTTAGSSAASLFIRSESAADGTLFDNKNTP
jgi:hypothetical protein